MHLVITEKQLRDIVKRRFPDQEISEQGEDAAAAAPEAGTSSDGETKTGMSKWESGVTRGPGNQIAVTRWKDIAGVTPARGKANPLWEQQKSLIDPLGLTAAVTKTVIDLDPRLDVPFKEYVTHMGVKYKIPANDTVRVNIWNSDKPRASKFEGAHQIEGIWFWDMAYTNPETKKIEIEEELAPDEATLAGWFPNNILRGIYVNKEKRYYGVFLRRRNNEWSPIDGYFFNPGEGQNLIKYKPELYVHTSTTTAFIEWAKNNKALIAEVLVSIVAGILTGGASLMVQALVQAGVSVAFAAGVYALSEKTEEDKIGLATGLAIAALPFIPAAINKFSLKGPLTGLAKYGDDLARATDEDAVARIIANFPEAEQMIIKTAFKEIPKHEFEKALANKAARGFAAQVRAGKIDLGKLPAHKLRFWQELLIEGGGAFPVSIGVGYVYRTIEERKKAEEEVDILSDGLEKKSNSDNVNKLAVDANTKKQQQVNQKPVAVTNTLTTNTQVKKTAPVTTIKTPEISLKNNPSKDGTFYGFTPKQPIQQDSTAIK